VSPIVSTWKHSSAKPETYEVSTWVQTWVDFNGSNKSKRNQCHFADTLSASYSD